MGLTSLSRNEIWYLLSSFAAHFLKAERPRGELN
jgi:hypothetical protein